VAADGKYRARDLQPRLAVRFTLMLPLGVGALVPAIFGLVEVAVGAVLTGIVEWTRSRAETLREHRAAGKPSKDGATTL
jgi:hypothetical protein